ncbi:unnamed protein product, partial [Staurois parvus]
AHWWVGTGGWAQVGGTGGQGGWAQVGGTSGHRCVSLQSGNGCTAGHRWVICWAQVGGASGRTAGHRWVALLGTDHQGTDHVLMIACHWTPLITW